MKKIDELAAKAFLNRLTMHQGNTVVEDDVMRLHGNKIAKIENNTIYISNAGWTSNTTKSRLNAILDMLDLPRIYQKDFCWYMGDKEFESDTWVKIALHFD